MSEALLRWGFRLMSVWAVLAALLVGAVLVLLADHDPIRAYATLFHGAFLDYFGFADTLVKLSPILLAGLAVALPLRSGLFNIGAEGQIYLGALFATVLALYGPPLPGWLGILFCAVVGMVGGALWAAIPALLRAYRNINEVIVTLLMNYVGINIVNFFVSGPMMAPGAPYPYSPEIPESLWLPHVMPRTDAHLGAVVAVAVALLLYFMVKRTTVGFALDTVRYNRHAAAYAGLSVRRTIVLSMVAGGALAGLAGAFEVLGLRYRLFHMFSDGYGFDGIVVAFLAGANPLGAVFAATLLAGLESGASVMQRAVGVPVTVIDVIKGLVIIFVAVGVALRFRETYWAEVLRRRRRVDELLAKQPAQG